MVHFLDRVLKNRASRRDPALCGFCKCSHIVNMLRFPKRRMPWLTAYGLMLAFQNPVSRGVLSNRNQPS
jgi:hypothetical protein